MKVFYDRRMVVPNMGSFSLSAEKPMRFMDYLDAKGVPYVLGEVTPVTAADLALAHSARYVDGVMSTRALNGFRNRDPRVPNSLLYTTGSFVSAAKQALIDGIALSPTSGFHHAGFNSGGGFCTFNGLMVAAHKLKQENLVQSVAILDCDEHYGNGTDAIIKRQSLGWVKHWTAGNYFGYHTEDAALFLKYLRVVLKRLLTADVLFYQAGADCHVDDPLGGFLTTEQMLERDRIVFTMAKEANVPVVWNFAGGYQEDYEQVLKLHLQTYNMARDIYTAIPA